MMREILFRGKMTDIEEKWVYGGYGVLGKNTDIEKHIIVESQLESNSSIPFFYFEDHEVNPKTVGQYTGLKDKNSVKIFEGDVVVVTYEKRPYVVEYWTDGWGRYVLVQDGKYFESDLADYEDIEVIGNIHDKEDKR